MLALETVNDRQKNIIKSLQLTFIFNTIFIFYFCTFHYSSLAPYFYYLYSVSHFK